MISLTFRNRFGEKLIDEGAKSLIVTLGSEDLLLSLTRIQKWQLKRFRPLTRLSRDAFVGAVAARLATGDSLEDATRIGNQVGAWVRHHGAQPSYPSAEDLSK